MNEDRRETIFTAIILVVVLAVIIADVAMFYYLLHYINDMLAQGEEILRQIGEAAHH